MNQNHAAFERQSHSIGRDIVACAAVGVMAVGMFLFSCWTLQIPPAWQTFEFCQYAEIGKNLAVEGKLETNLVEPMALAYLDAHQTSARGPRWPVINRYPLSSLLTAGFIRIFGANDLAAAASNGLSAALLCITGFVLARRWLGTGWGWLFALLFLSNPCFFGFFVLMGTPDILFALLFLLQMVSWSFLFEEGNKSTRALWFGLFSGLAFLARFNMSIFLALQFMALVVHRQWRAVLIAGGESLAVVLPLLMYNMHHFGKPLVSIYSSWNLLDGVGAYKVEPWLYYHDIDRATDISPRVGAIFTKWRQNFFEIAPLRIWSLWGLYLLMPAAAVGLLFPIKNRVASRTLRTGAFLFLLQLILFSALRLELVNPRTPWHGRYFFWFAAPAMLLGLNALRTAWSKRSLRWIVPLVVIGQLVIFGWIWREWIGLNQMSSRNFVGQNEVYKMLRQVVPKDRIIASDSPQVLLWRCDLKSISLPADPIELKKIEAASPRPIDFILINLNLSSIDLDPRWRAFVDPGSGTSDWERVVLKDFDYVFDPAATRQDRFVLLKRRGVITGDYKPATKP